MDFELRHMCGCFCGLWQPRLDPGLGNSLCSQGKLQPQPLSTGTRTLPSHLYKARLVRGTQDISCFNKLLSVWEDRRGVNGEQLPEPAIGSLGDNDGHVGHITLWQLLHLLHHRLLIEPAAGTRKNHHQACWEVSGHAERWCRHRWAPPHDSPKLGSPKVHTQREDLPACGTQH